jgi:hypothetical protein
MPRVVPSQIVEFLADRFPNVLPPPQTPTQFPFVPGNVGGLVALLDMLPHELLPTGSDYAALITAQEALRAGIHEQLMNHGPNLTGGEAEAVRDLDRIILRLCPDSAAPAGTTDPSFIDDEELRADLHHDLGDVNRALQNGEWKAATVLAGSVVEALLLWALQRRKSTEVAAKEAAVSQPIEKWSLGALIELACDTGLIKGGTRTVADEGKDYRNLIHPGRATRLGKKCNRATALIGVGALEAVMNDLAK